MAEIGSRLEYDILEAVIREAIEQTLASAEDAVKKIRTVYDVEDYTEAHSPSAVKDDVIAAIRSLKPAKSGMEVKK